MNATDHGTTNGTHPAEPAPDTPRRLKAARTPSTTKPAFDDEAYFSDPANGIPSTSVKLHGTAKTYRLKLAGHPPATRDGLVAAANATDTDHGVTQENSVVPGGRAVVRRSTKMHGPKLGGFIDGILSLEARDAE